MIGRRRPATDVLTAAVRRAPLFDAAWYAARYPDVARLGLDPAEHFVRIGAALGRDPGPGFRNRDYFTANPDVALAGRPAFLHWLEGGAAEGRALRPSPAPRPGTDPLARHDHLRGLLQTGGLTEAPRAELRAMARSGGRAEAAAAAETLAVWTLRHGSPAEAARWIERRLDLGRSPAALRRLAPLALLAAARTGDVAGAARLLSTAPESPGLHMAAIALDRDESTRIARLNRALASDGLAPVTAADGSGALFDRLSCSGPADPESTAPDAPVVSVLVAAHAAEATLATALASLTAQSWRALEIIVIDDASPDGTAAVAAGMAARDPRIRLVRLPANLGAYGARNAGLAAATGTWVTLHDADDWAHPERIARQLRHLRGARGQAGCLSLQARVTGDLSVARWTGTGAVLNENLAALMLPRALLTRTLGGWDRVTVSADSELLRRVRLLYGAGSVDTLGTAPLGLLRAGADSATADGATGMDWFYYGARQEYHEAQTAHHATGATLYDPAPGAARPFPAPAILCPGPDRRAEQRLDLVLAGYLGLMDGALEALVDRLDTARAEGAQVGLVPLAGMHLPVGTGPSIHPALRRRIDGAGVRVLCFGEEAETAAFAVFGPDPAPLRYLPVIRHAGKVVLAPAG